MKEGPLVFGVDGGATKSRLRIADGSNRSLWEGEGEGINPNALAAGELSSRLESLFLGAFHGVGLGPADFAAGCLGVAGADRPGEAAEIEAILRGKLGLACPLRVTSDPEIALVGGLESLEGLILIAGTGSIAVARLRNGERIRAGGLGHFLGDEGSAFFLGFEALKRAIRSSEGRDLPTAMLPRLLDSFGLGSAQDAVAFVYRRFDKARIAAAAGLVEEARAAGDELAADIMDGARDELASLVASVYDRASGRLGRREVALAGGLVTHNAWLRSGLVAALAERCPGLAATEPRESAAWGACLLALDLAGICIA